MSACGLEGPPPVLQFDRYAKSIINTQASRQPVRFATQISLGEIVDQHARPPAAVSVPTGHLQALNVPTPARRATLDDFLETAQTLNSEEENNTQGSRLGRPLTCPGLPIKTKALRTTATTGLRRTPFELLKAPRPGGVLEQMPWTSPLSNIDYQHHLPFESTFQRGKEQHPFTVADTFTDSKGNHTENARYSHFHAARMMRELVRRGNARKTDWSHTNVRGRRRPFRAAAAGAIKPPSKTLYLATEALLTDDDLEKTRELRNAMDVIKTERRRFHRASCGKDKQSRQRQEDNRARFRREQKERKGTIQKHIMQHDGRVLSYITAFNAADVDRSGTINAAELEMVLRHLGLEFSGESIAQLLARYDTDHDETLSLAEFMKFARDAMRDTESRSIFLRKEALMKMAK